MFHVLGIHTAALYIWMILLFNFNTDITRFASRTDPRNLLSRLSWSIQKCTHIGNLLVRPILVLLLAELSPSDIL
jgi:hypothetical protein